MPPKHERPGNKDDLYPPNAAQLEVFASEAAGSLEAQQRTESSDTVSFDDFVAAWFAG